MQLSPSLTGVPFRRQAGRARGSGFGVTTRDCIRILRLGPQLTTTGLKITGSTTESQARYSLSHSLSHQLAPDLAPPCSLSETPCRTFVLGSPGQEWGRGGSTNESISPSNHQWPGPYISLSLSLPCLCTQPFSSLRGRALRQDLSGSRLPRVPCTNNHFSLGTPSLPSCCSWFQQ